MRITQTICRSHQSPRDRRLRRVFRRPDLALDALVDASKAVPLYAHKFWQPLFSEVRKLPEFKRFLRTGGFLDYWHGYGWPASRLIS